ncbi:DNA translocase FtsK 4TM domain-containing protein [Candidatus Saccharibacteria bacterium]|nr:DNA translocase FtsK 4TM domain-containing protein [Candidatus Saccharibacteria bacterium]
MSKKKKRSHKKKVAKKEVPQEPNMFVRQLGSVAMIVVAIFLLLGGFGTGGSLPVGLFDLVYKVFGIAAYLSPVALIYWAVHKFRAEEHNLPPSRLFSMSALLITFSSWLHVAFVARDFDTAPYYGGNGGGLGEVVGGAVLAALDKFPASIMFFILTILSACWAFGIPLKVFLIPFKKREREPDTDLESLKEKSGGFKLNEGVPVEHHSQQQRSSFKNSVSAKLTPEENHEALTVASDPDWQFPTTELLIKKQDKADAGDVNGNADIIKDTFQNFNIDVDMEGANIGPRVTQFTLRPPAGIKLSKISALDRELALNLAAQSIRIEAPIPGKRAVGIEVPNVKSATVRIAGILDDKTWKSGNDPLSFAIGRDIAGLPVVAALNKMPHLLIAGQTGSGKSVMINTLLTSMLYNNSPADMKLILVDPKQVELTPYNDIPHLLTPVITEPEKCISALKWAVSEMERRLRTFAEHHKRNIAEYNNLKDQDSMPYIVIVIDELADLMMMAARDVEALIVRIAQKARAAGIHLVLATQRPSVDVITGLIKANVPARIAFTVASQVDSRTIIDGVGAEKLLGMGDMLFSTSDMPKPIRVQGAFISDGETVKVNDFLRMQRPPQYDDEVVSQPVQLNGKGGIVADNAHNADSDDDMFRDAVRVVMENRKASTSLLQRRLRIGYGRASRLIDEMEDQGIVSPADGAKPRDVLITSMDDVFSTGGQAGSTPDEVLDENF